MPPTTSNTPRVVLITGASSGIGREVALALAERGDALVLLARRRPELAEVAATCSRLGASRVLVQPADVSDAHAWDEAFEAAVAEFGRVDVVVHAAAVAAYGRFTEVPGEVFDRVQDINLVGTANVARTSLKHFESRRGGHLVLIGSLVGKIGTPFLSPYVVSKWAVHGLARTLQAELVGTPVDVSLVSPGGVSTTIYDKAASYLGVQGKPPPPVYDARRAAAAVVRVVDHPRRDRAVGFLNPVVSLGFRLMPGVYDRLVAPLMTRLALGTTPVADHPG
ncbi:MAG TPA: SDR family NAD(P)-dependent oxidoreductase, partial [Nocardioides sp.]|nr:SDR family NAD(P)-dependent oxidoreductase [Nocardioides sp.]